MNKITRKAAENVQFNDIPIVIYGNSCQREAYIYRMPSKGKLAHSFSWLNSTYFR